MTSGWEGSSCVLFMMGKRIQQPGFRSSEVSQVCAFVSGTWGLSSMINESHDLFVGCQLHLLVASSGLSLGSNFWPLNAALLRCLNYQQIPNSWYHRHDLLLLRFYQQGPSHGYLEEFLFSMEKLYLVLANFLYLRGSSDILIR